MIRLLLAVALSSAVLAGPRPAAKSASCATPPQPGRPYLKPENEIEERLIAFACKPILENQSALADAMIRGTIFVRVDPSSLDPKTGTPGADGARIAMVETIDGAQALGVYTSKKALFAAFEDGEPLYYFAYQGDSFLGVNGQRAIAVNWGIDPHVLFEPNFFKLAAPSADAVPNER